MVCPLRKSWTFGVRLKLPFRPPSGSGDISVVRDILSGNISTIMGTGPQNYRSVKHFCRLLDGIPTQLPDDTGFKEKKL